MFSTEEIIREIDQKVNFYRSWACGLACDPDGCRRQHGEPRFWYSWQAGTHDDARAVVEYLRSRRMRLHEDEGTAPCHVYVYFQPGNWRGAAVQDN